MVSSPAPRSLAPASTSASAAVAPKPQRAPPPLPAKPPASINGANDATADVSDVATALPDVRASPRVQAGVSVASAAAPRLGSWFRRNSNRAVASGGGRKPKVRKSGVAKAARTLAMATAAANGDVIAEEEVVEEGEHAVGEGSAVASQSGDGVVSEEVSATQTDAPASQPRGGGGRWFRKLGGKAAAAAASLKTRMSGSNAGTPTESPALAPSTASSSELPSFSLFGDEDDGADSATLADRRAAQAALEKAADMAKKQRAVSLLRLAGLQAGDDFLFSSWIGGGGDGGTGSGVSMFSAERRCKIPLLTEPAVEAAVDAGALPEGEVLKLSEAVAAAAEGAEAAESGEDGAVVGTSPTEEKKKKKKKKKGTTTTRLDPCVCCCVSM